AVTGALKAPTSPRPLTAAPEAKMLPPSSYETQTAPGTPATPLGPTASVGWSVPALPAMVSTLEKLAPPLLLMPTSTTVAAPNRVTNRLPNLSQTACASWRPEGVNPAMLLRLHGPWAPVVL